ncbi:Dihydroorotate dehydrogenase (quinone), mitochondrial [Linum grandiflorum]
MHLKRLLGGVLHRPTVYAHPAATTRGMANRTPGFSSSSSASKIPCLSRKIQTFLMQGRLLSGGFIGLVLAGGAYVGTLDEATFCGWLFDATKVVNPLFALLDPETAHRLAVLAAARGWIPREKRPDPPILELQVWGRKFSNPVGLAAGFDKNAEAIGGLLAVGFGFIEVGSITPLPQQGNPKPRLFRLREQSVDRYGFNNEGILAVAKRLGAQHVKRQSDPSSDVNDVVKQGHGIMGISLGKNKESEDAVSDYIQGVINVSSPNTPGLRNLQGKKQLEDLVNKVQAARDGIQRRPPLLIKIGPDLSKQDLEDIAAVAIALRLDGLIISNSTIQRPDSVKKNPVAKESGALSGKPLFDLSTDILKEMYMLTRAAEVLAGDHSWLYFPLLISGEDAYKKIRAGATLVQLYTAFAYAGPALIPQIKAELAECLERDGFKSVVEAVGADHR